jgi:cell division septation protein DedD
MADTHDRNHGSDHDLFDETAPRSIFAATWFRAVLVLIVLGVVGAVAVPYILDAMNAPKPSATAKLPTPVPPPSKPAPPPASAPVTPATGPAAVTPPLPSSGPTGAAAMTPAAPPMPTPLPSSAPPGPVAAATPVPAPPAVTPAPMPPTPTEKASEPTKDSVVGATTPSETSKTEPKTKPAAAKPAAKTAKPAATRQWFVQVGAFKNAATAKKVAAKLRDANYTVEESPRGGPAATVAKATTTSPTRSGGDQYDVIITGQAPAETNTRLAARGLTTEPVDNGAVVKPSLPLRDAVALSKELAVDGLKVQVRRAGGSTAPAPKSSSSGTTASASGDTLHRVSVGGFADRATAVATLKELEAKGYKPFLTRR